MYHLSKKNRAEVHGSLTVTIGSQYVYGDEVGGTSKHIVGMEGVNILTGFL